MRAKYASRLLAEFNVPEDDREFLTELLTSHKTPDDEKETLIKASKPPESPVKETQRPKSGSSSSSAHLQTSPSTPFALPGHKGSNPGWYALIPAYIKAVGETQEAIKKFLRDGEQREKQQEVQHKKDEKTKQRTTKKTVQSPFWEDPSGSPVVTPIKPPLPGPGNQTRNILDTQALGPLSGNGRKRKIGQLDHTVQHQDSTPKETPTVRRVVTTNDSPRPRSSLVHKPNIGLPRSPASAASIPNGAPQPASYIDPSYLAPLAQLLRPPPTIQPTNAPVTQPPRANTAKASPKKPATSPYFDSAKPKSPSKRPPRGTVSCVQFPPLTDLSFGLIQEKLSQEPFHLLIAVTFLIRTTGKAAIPVFNEVMTRFPTPAALANPDNVEELTGMIRHLGLSAVRVAAIRRYAIGWITNPPRPGIRFKVRNYERRDMEVRDQDGEESLESDPELDSTCPVALASADDPEAWEIGHLTQGRYAIDSWRIFCRDRLLGRARDWNGKGRAADFQPEWMRVQPRDKELRACLRWMWMREGWEWDPVTGERTVLRGEMQRAVNEGRVEWNDAGELNMVSKASVTRNVK